MTHFDRIETNPPMSQMTADSREGKTHPITGVAMEVHRQLIRIRFQNKEESGRHFL